MNPVPADMPSAGPRSSGYAIRWPRIGDLPSPQCSQRVFMSFRFAGKDNGFC